MEKDKDLHPASRIPYPAKPIIWLEKGFSGYSKFLSLKAMI